MKTKRIKAWHGPTVLVLDYMPSSTVFVLPADAESYERMVEQGARAIYPNLVPITKVSWVKAWADDKRWLRHAARAALRAIGITAPKRGKKGRQ